MEIMRWKFMSWSRSTISLGLGYFVSSKNMPPQFLLPPQ